MTADGDRDIFIHYDPAARAQPSTTSVDHTEVVPVIHPVKTALYIVNQSITGCQYGM